MTSSAFKALDFVLKKDAREITSFNYGIFNNIALHVADNNQ